MKIIVFDSSSGAGAGAGAALHQNGDLDKCLDSQKNDMLSSHNNGEHQDKIDKTSSKEEANSSRQTSHTRRAWIATLVIAMILGERVCSFVFVLDYQMSCHVHV